MNHLSNPTPEQVVQENLNAYNTLDIEAFMRSFSDNIALYNFNNPVPTLTGLDQVREFYGELFDQSPDLLSTVTKRICLGNKVIDHESITGRKSSKEIIELVLIYEVESEKINKITVMKALT